MVGYTFYFNEILKHMEYLTNSSMITNIKINSSL